MSARRKSEPGCLELLACWAFALLLGGALWALIVFCQGYGR